MHDWLHKHRAIKTGWIVLDALDQAWIPHYCHWRLNERFYGDMVGKDPASATAAFGADRVALWRDSYTVPPVPMPRSSSRHPWNQLRYKLVQHRFFHIDTRWIAHAC
jgi:2,3-bisphosphoglycerate-dependent phosphoglycerate mutase